MKTIAFTVADKNNSAYAENLRKSFNKFHPDIEFRIYGDDYCQKSLSQDKQFFYKQKPWIMRELIDEYELVIGFDSDSVVTGKLDFILDGGYDIGVVNNFSNLDVQQYGVVSTLNIAPQVYLNCGLVATTSKRFINHWWNLCSNQELFNSFRYREQDLLNIICYYGDYNFSNFDLHGAGFYGLSGKDLWHEATVKNDELVVEFTDDKGKVVLTRPIKVIHVAGGNTPNKMELSKYFNEKSYNFIKSLYE